MKVILRRIAIGAIFIVCMVTVASPVSAVSGNNQQEEEFKTPDLNVLEVNENQYDVSGYMFVIQEAGYYTGMWARGKVHAPDASFKSELKVHRKDGLWRWKNIFYWAYEYGNSAEINTEHARSEYAGDLKHEACVGGYYNGLSDRCAHEFTDKRMNDRFDEENRNKQGRITGYKEFYNIGYRDYAYGCKNRPADFAYLVGAKEGYDFSNQTEHIDTPDAMQKRIDKFKRNYPDLDSKEYVSGFLDGKKKN